MVLGDDSRRYGKLLLDMSNYKNTLKEKEIAIGTLFSNQDWT